MYKYFSLVASGNREVLNDERLVSHCIRELAFKFWQFRMLICGPRETTPKEVTNNVMCKS
jgi:hypothetical protein